MTRVLKRFRRNLPKWKKNVQVNLE